MTQKSTARRRVKSSADGAECASFIYRGVRITPSWANSSRKRKIGEAVRKVIENGPARTQAG